MDTYMYSHVCTRSSASHIPFDNWVVKNNSNAYPAEGQSHIGVKNVHLSVLSFPPIEYHKPSPS